jgi:multicomponent Na+:H+ antiporter subunit D
MTNWIPPASILISGAILMLFVNNKLRRLLLLLVPAVTLLNLFNMAHGHHYTIDFLGYELVFGRVDKLSMVFGYIFVIISFIGALFSIHLEKKGEHIAAFLYAGSALGVVFAGDYLSLFIFWEIMAVASTFLIWSRGTKSSHKAGFRYILAHLAGGLLLFAGIIMHVSATGSLRFDYVGLNGLPSYLILLGFALNAAIPPLSAWLSDAYPEATVTGAVFMSALTTKTAVYVLLRGFPGTELLIWFGAVMAFYGVVFAVLVNDIRRILAYHIISQVGFMVAGIGIGTALALNGAVAHAFAHILYKGLLFMGAGAVLHVTGKSKLTELGGLYKTMPITFSLYMIGALSISAFPLFSGFVSKSMVVSAAAEEHLTAIWILLTVSSAGTFLHTGLKLPYFTWFGKDSGIIAKEPPKNMLMAMGIAAFLCILIGVYPAMLYNLLPFGASYAPYTADHVVWMLQFLLFTGVGFFMLLKHLAGEPYVVLDTDWFYRKGAGVFVWFISNPMAQLSARVSRLVFESIPSSLSWASKNPVAAFKIASDTVLLQFSSPGRRAAREQGIKREKEIYPGDIIEHWPIGSTVLWITLFLLACLLIYYA